MELDPIQQMLFISVILSTISCAFIQKTKSLFKTNKYLIIYSLVVNLLFSIIFCYSFTSIRLPSCLWVGLFAFVGADTLYKTLEGKLTSHSDIRK